MALFYRRIRHKGGRRSGLALNTQENNTPPNLFSILGCLVLIAGIISLGTPAGLPLILLGLTLMIGSVIFNYCRKFFSRPEKPENTLSPPEQIPTPAETDKSPSNPQSTLEYKPTAPPLSMLFIPAPSSPSLTPEPTLSTDLRPN